MENFINSKNLLKTLKNGRQAVNFIQKRWRKNTKHAYYYQVRRPSEPHELAKEFLDGLYSTRFGNQWPSIRCAMLSRKKYAAIINNHSNPYELEEELKESGAVDIVLSLQEKAKSMLKDIENAIDELNSNRFLFDQGREQNNEMTVQDGRPDVQDSNFSDQSEKIIFQNGDLIFHDNKLPGEFGDQTAQDGTTVQDGTEYDNDKLRYHDKRLNWLQSHRKKYQALSSCCTGLKVFAYNKGNLTEFVEPQSRRQSRPILDYFLLDGSSILPILALDIKPKDHVLDMCAAPGGKLLCSMQLCTGTGSIIANDVEKSRVKRIQRVQDEYIPKNSDLRKRMKIMNTDGTMWSETETSTYDKVLVDVPCIRDRHSLLPSLKYTDNIFSPLRKRERANLPMLQSDVLRNAVMACRPGGTVVYSTCTASKQQNEYIVQMTIQLLLENHGIVCEIEDLSPLTHILKDHFHFFPDIEVGALILPFLDANFGPTYVCKIVRKR